MSIAFCFGLDETSAVCAFAIGELKRSSAAVKVIMRFIIAKGISRRDINRPSVGKPPEGLSEWTRYLRYPGHRLNHGGLSAFLYISKLLSYEREELFR